MSRCEKKRRKSTLFEATGTRGCAGGTTTGGTIFSFLQLSERGGGMRTSHLQRQFRFQFGAEERFRQQEDVLELTHSHPTLELRTNEEREAGDERN